MIFNTTQKPKLGDTRKSTRFSFFPTKINDKWYWLEFYDVEELYISRNYNYWVSNKFFYCGQLIENRNVPIIPPKPNQKN